MEKTNFRNELERLNKGVKIAWFINFIILALTIEAAIIVGLMSMKMSTDALLVFILITLVISLIIAGIITSIISKNSGKILMGAAEGNMIKVNSGVVYDVVAEMAVASMQQMPEVYIAKGSPVANAYAVSDSKASRVVITDKLLNIMTREELQGVIGHEIAHIASGDSKAMTTLTALTSVTGIIAGFTRDVLGDGGDNDDNDKGKNPVAIVIFAIAILFLIAAPFLAKIAEAYMSRERESTADMLSVKYTRNPTALANALFKLKYEDGQINKADAQKFNKMAGQVAFYIPSFEGMALSTHPPLDKRIQKLVNMGATINENQGLLISERMQEMHDRTLANNNRQQMPVIPGIQPGYNPRDNHGMTVNNQNQPYNRNGNNNYYNPQQNGFNNPNNMNPQQGYNPNQNNENNWGPRKYKQPWAR